MNETVEQRRARYRHAFVAAFGEEWEARLSLQYLTTCSAFSHEVTSFMMMLYVADVWPTTWPSRSIDMAWRAWDASMQSHEKCAWSIHYTESREVRADYRVSFPGSFRAFSLRAGSEDLAGLLCRMFLCQAWLVATAPEEAKASSTGGDIVREIDHDNQYRIIDMVDAHMV